MRALGSNTRIISRRSSALAVAPVIWSEKSMRSLCGREFTNFCLGSWLAYGKFTYVLALQIDSITIGSGEPMSFVIIENWSISRYVFIHELFTEDGIRSFPGNKTLEVIISANIPAHFKWGHRSIYILHSRHPQHCRIFAMWAWSPALCNIASWRSQSSLTTVSCVQGPDHKLIPNNLHRQGCCWASNHCRES